MRLRDLLIGMTAASAATFVYGMLYEANRLVLERRRLVLAGWPKEKSIYRIAVISDLHVKDSYSAELASRAIRMALEESPDMIVLPGDLVAFWKPESAEMLETVLAPLKLMNGNVIATPGNREYWQGSPELLIPIFEKFDIKLLRNESLILDEIEWVGVDSANARRADPFAAMGQVGGAHPIITLWHEPDLVEWLPVGSSLMISGHSHGGQFRLPNGWAPVNSVNGKLYQDGYFAETSTPLYVSRGIGTTGPPSRLFCPPEVSLLTIVSPDDPGVQLKK